jgi:hypothetical protein
MPSNSVPAQWNQIIQIAKTIEGFRGGDLATKEFHALNKIATASWRSEQIGAAVFPTSPGAPETPQAPTLK